jgi:hypothetical protein
MLHLIKWFLCLAVVPETGNKRKCHGVSGVPLDYVINTQLSKATNRQRHLPQAQRTCEYAIQYALFSNQVNVRVHLGDISYLSMGKWDGWLCVVPDNVWPWVDIPLCKTLCLQTTLSFSYSSHSMAIKIVKKRTTKFKSVPKIAWTFWLKF